jgi:hypothetical protein
MKYGYLFTFKFFYLLGTTEYLFPIPSKMVPLMDRCYLPMTQALESRLGGYPQKTESVKALGHQLGHFVHVFKYNETGFLTVCVRYNFARGSISFRTYFNLVLLAGWSLGLF